MSQSSPRWRSFGTSAATLPLTLPVLLFALLFTLTIVGTACGDDDGRRVRDPEPTQPIDG